MPADGSDILLINYHDAVIYPSDLALLDSTTDWLNDACINFHMRHLEHTQDERRDDARGGGGGSSDMRKQNRGTDLFLDPSVVSFLVHQLSEHDEDYDEELLNLNASWDLPRPPTYGRNVDGTENAGNESHPRGDTSSTRNRTTKRIFVPINDQFCESKAVFARPGGGRHWTILLWEIDATYYEIDGGFNATVGVGFYHFDSSRGVNKSAAEVVAKKLDKVLRASMSPHDGVPDSVDVVECQTPQQRNGHDCGLFALGFAESLSGSANDFIVNKENCESLLRNYFETNGGHEEFALRLRKCIGDRVRELAGLNMTKSHRKRGGGGGIAPLAENG